MAGITMMLNIAEQTLQNTQTELATSSNNISNANTTGYATETAVQTESPQIDTTGGWIGTGASVTNITQARDNYLEQELMNATSGGSQYTSLSTQMSTIESAASDSGDTGISQALGNFFDSWSTLAQDPTSSSVQTNVYSTAQSLANSIQNTYSQLSSINDQLSTQVTDTIGQANTLISQIAGLNQQIEASGSSTQPNSLIDEQYSALDSLSQLIPVTYTTNADGTVDVSTTEDDSAVSLVSDQTVVNSISDPSGISTGQLGGLLQAQTNLSGYMSQFDDLAGTLANEANSTSGLAIFSGSTASTITAGSDFLSGETSSQLSSISSDMANLQDSSVSFTDGTSSTLQGYLDNTQETIGNDAESANTNQAYNSALQSELQTQQQSVSGVSVDQELVNVMQYQQIYQAAAKVVETASTLMTTAINM